MTTLPVEIVRSKKRRKTVQAVMVGGVIRVHVPARLSQDEIDLYVAELVPRLERRYRSDHIDLAARASVLARRYRFPQPTSIVWADNQRKRWGSCDTRSGDIRISTRLAEFPPWVLDYVIVHELAHLVVSDHSAAFAALVERYPRAERACGYLIAKQDDPIDGSRNGELGPDWTEEILDDLGADEPLPEPPHDPPHDPEDGQRGKGGQGHLDLDLTD
jgi:predicted metal-dependent hydrolase